MRIAWAANFGVAAMTNTSAPEPCSVDDLRIDGRLGGLVGGLLDQHAGMVGAEPVLQPDQIVLAEVVVLVEHADLRVGLGRQDVLGVDARLGLVVRVEAHRPGKMLGIGEHAGAGGDEQLRHLVVVEILPDRQDWAAVPSVLKMNATCSCSTSRRICSTVFGGL